MECEVWKTKENEMMIRQQWEYYCYGCGQLRLHVCRQGSTDKPVKCIKCDCKNIEVDKVGSEELTKLRYGNNQPSPNSTDIEFY